MIKAFAMSQSKTSDEMIMIAEQDTVSDRIRVEEEIGPAIAKTMNIKNREIADGVEAATEVVEAMTEAEGEAKIALAIERTLAGGEEVEAPHRGIRVCGEMVS